MTQHDITDMLRAYNNGLMTSNFEHFDFIAQLSSQYNEIKELYSYMNKVRYELDDDGFYKDNSKLIRHLENTISIVQNLIDDMENDFIRFHSVFSCSICSEKESLSNVNYRYCFDRHTYTEEKICSSCNDDQNDYEADYLGDDY